MIRVNNFWQGLSLFLLNLGPKTPSYANERKQKKGGFSQPHFQIKEKQLYMGLQMQILLYIFQSSSQIRPWTSRLYLATHSTAAQKTEVIFVLSGMGTTKTSDNFLYTSVKNLCKR